MEKYILHIDGDAFFAACEVSRRPDLKNKPVVVGEDRGIACALTYEAKKLGISRGMPVFQIRKLYPQVMVLTSHFDLYEAYHFRLIRLLKKRLSIVESYSIDECFAEIESDDLKLEKTVREIKNEVQEALGITFSFGAAKTKTLAKLASKTGKPDGCFILTDQQKIDQVLSETPVSLIWGIGRSISASLVGKNILTAFDFARLPGHFMDKYYSAPVISTWLELKGKSVYKIDPNFEDKKSIQATRSMTKETNSREMIFSELSRNTERACRHLRESGLFAKRAYFYSKTIHPYNRRFGGEIILPSYTNNPADILKILENKIDFVCPRNITYKSTGIALYGLRRKQLIPQELFSDSRPDETLLKALDAIQNRYGKASIIQASSLKSVIKRSKESTDRESRDNYIFGLPLIYMGEAE